MVEDQRADPEAGPPEGETVLPLAPTPPMPKVGQTLGPYELVEVLGRGGMGVIYRAECKKMCGEVAIKFLATDGLSDRGIVERFMREARLAIGIKTDPITLAFVYGC